MKQRKMSGRVYGFLFALFLICAIVVWLFVPVVSTEATDLSDYELNGTTIVYYIGDEEEVITPDGMEQIGLEAFSGNQSVTKVIVSEGVIELGYGAFSHMTNLEEVILPNSLETIGKDAFADCENLNKITIGSNTRYIKEGAFSNCSSLEECVIGSENIWFTVEDQIIYNKDKTCLVAMLGGRTDATYTMPSTVTQMEAFSCYGNLYLEQVSLSSNLESISPYAFANGKLLSQVSIPYSVKEIEMCAFADCKNLEDITIPSSVQTIHELAFSGSGVETEDGTGDKVDVEEHIEDSLIKPGDTVSDNDVLGETVIVNNEAVVLTDYE